MADITVTTFAEFRTAAAQSGNTIICPNNAVWDMSVIDPENTITKITIKSNVTGNNTTIKNFRGCIECGSGITITALHNVNMLCESAGYGAICTESRSVYPNEPVWQQSRISAAIGANVDTMFYNIKITRCAANVSMQKSNAVTFTSFYSGSVQNVLKYNNIALTLPNATDLYFQHIKSSKFVLDAPLLKKFYAVPLNCTFRGNMQTVDTLGYSSSETDFSVVIDTNAPNFPSCTWMKKVTDAQMRDADYLASIGFVIGTE